MGVKTKESAQKLREERELEEFIAAKKEARKTLVKRIVVTVICLALVLCFCLPALSTLVM